MRQIVAAFLLLCAAERATAQDKSDIATTLMRSTFKLSGPGQTGTAFVLAKPSSSDKSTAYYVLVTAAHVLSKMTGETATLTLRKRAGASYEAHPWPVRIRQDSRDLWTRHPSVDVAVMYVDLPNEADLHLVSTTLLATDEVLTRIGIGPGDRLSCLGFPLNAASNDAWFPILRSGYIASYPITPTKSVKTMLFDFNVFEGNSGGPVYFWESGPRRTGNALNVFSGGIPLLMGLVSQQVVFNENVQTQGEASQKRTRLGLGVVIHASLILETMERLPPEPSPRLRTR